jgi:hypothetical protein
MPATQPAASRPRFADFYRDVFLPEHRHPGNRMLHIAGTLLGLAWLAALVLWPAPWWARVAALLLFPLVHAAPGLIGHRLFERSAVVGDARWRRRDWPAPWFIAANHWLTAQWLMQPFSRRPGSRRPRS